MLVVIISLWASLIIAGVIAINYYLKYTKCKKEAGRSKSYLSDEKLSVIEAFTINGKKYFMYEDALHTPSGRALYALAVYEELNMKADREYLQAHVRATELILDRNPIRLTALAQINQNLKERLNMGVLPDYIFKLASILFFDETESPYTVNAEYNLKKIEEWKKQGIALDFFLNTPLKDLVPYLKLPASNAGTYFRVAEMVDETHRTKIQEVLSNEG